MPAAYSNEGRILTSLRDLELPARNFVDIAKSLNIQISHGRLSEALNDKIRLDDSTGVALLELVGELKAVGEKFPDIPINWGRTEKIATLVILERVTRICAELDQQPITMQQ